jgi:hypothetical protein
VSENERLEVNGHAKAIRSNHSVKGRVRRRVRAKADGHE